MYCTQLLPEHNAVSLSVYLSRSPLYLDTAASFASGLAPCGGRTVTAGISTFLSIRCGTNVNLSSLSVTDWTIAPFSSMESMEPTRASISSSKLLTTSPAGADALVQLQITKKHSMNTKPSRYQYT